MSESTDPSELASNDGELSNDDAVLAHLMQKEEPAVEGAEAEEVAEQEETAEEVEEATEAEAEVAPEDDDPEIDLGEIKLKKSELKAGYMKDADYRQKTAATAERQRQLDAAEARIQQERDHYANQLDATLNAMQRELIGDQEALAHLAATDPAEWVAQNAAFQQRVAKFQQGLTERQALSARQEADQQRKHDEWSAKERDALKTKLPEWRDQKIAAKEQSEIAQYLLDQGYSREDLSSLQDHRALLTARDAAKWREHLKSKESVKEKKVQAPPAKAIKPGAAQTNQAEQGVAKIEQLKARAKRTGDQDDIANYLMAKSGS